MRRRGWVGVVVGMAVAACGIDVVGIASAPVPGERDSGAHASSSSSSSSSSGGTLLLDAASEAGSDGGANVIKCPGPSCPADKKVVCPPGAACEIDCVAPDACDLPSCGAAASCVINCDGKNACGGGALCGTAGSCAIHCLTADACGGPLECQKANPGYSCSLFCNAPNCGAYAYCCARNDCTISESFQQKSDASCDP